MLRNCSLSPVNLAAFPEEVVDVSQDFAVAALPAFTPVGGQHSGAS